MKTKTLNYYAVVVLIGIGMTSCSKDDVKTGGGGTGNTNLEQFTPNKANWSTFESKVKAVKSITSHDPDGIGWLTKESWEKAKWDGKPFDPTKKTKKEFYDCMCPSADQVRGLREVFYKHKPFADNKNPTKAEVDEWHRIAINHVRALVGYTGEEYQVKKDHCLFARALWGDERKYTTNWDKKYPGKNGSAAGPCQGSSNAHCGASFYPSKEDQAAYLPAGHAGCGPTGGAEGVFSASKSNIPWSIKWSRSFCVTLKQEGFWGGHVGPWFIREKFGFNFWDSDPKNPNSIAILRAKWSGKKYPSKYPRP